MKINYFTIIIICLLSMFVLASEISAREQIRPANQLPSRGVGVNIRPPNQMFVSHESSEYNHSQEDFNTTGSDYSSDYYSKESKHNITRTIIMKAKLNGAKESRPTSSKAKGTGYFIIDEKANTLTYNITISNLEGNEKGAAIYGPEFIEKKAGLLFSLPMGKFKSGVLTYNESLEKNLLSGKMYINILSDKFPKGEIRGKITLYKRIIV